MFWIYSNYKSIELNFFNIIILIQL
jgi:hypothetical protein